MRKEKIEDFSFKITQANKTQLLVLVYEIILEELSTARELYEKEEIESFVETVKKAQTFVQELMRTLDYNYSIATDLLALYVYMNKKIIEAIVKQKIEPLDGIEEIVYKLKQSFDTLSKSDHSAPIMKETQQVYAGFTYTKDQLSETYINLTDERSTGFQA